MQRWALSDPVTGDSYVMRANPKTMATPVVPHRTQAARSRNGTVRALRRPDQPSPWSFAGRLRTALEYATLEDWAARGRIVVTDHLGRQHQVQPQSFEPTPVERSGAGNPWLMDYTFKALYLKRLA